MNVTATTELDTTDSIGHRVNDTLMRIKDELFEMREWCSDRNIMIDSNQAKAINEAVSDIELALSNIAMDKGAFFEPVAT